jgi:3-oxoadipate enol-lactonase
MVSTRHVVVGGRRIRYFESGAGWPVVLVHAFPLSAEMWRPQLEAVPDGYRFIAPDVRGLGGSPVEAGPPPGMDDYAADVAGLLDALELDRAVIGGLSIGGYISFALFRRAPERFSAMILADTRSAADTAEGRQARLAMSEALRAKGSSAVADQMIPRLLSGGTHRRKPEVVKLVRTLIEKNDPAGLDGAVNAMMHRPDSTPDVARISIPVLIVVGQEDVLTPVADSERLHAAIQRSQLVVIPGAGHLSNLEAPEEFSLALEDFLRANI